jgi:ATP adenylyltransferase
MMNRLWTPWRYPYILMAKENKVCLFCEALASHADEEKLILWRAAHNFVILNRYPYSNGHLMVAPNRHEARLSDSAAAHSAEMMELVKEAERILEEVYTPDGINIGVNVGRCAGAGVVDHHHIHMVPRWEGDTNFMSVFNEVRIIPEALDATYKRLKPKFDERLGAGRSRK